MKNLSNIGRIFYGISIAEIGFQAICYRAFPYIVPLPKYFWMPGAVMLAFVSGLLFILAGACIIFEKKTRSISLLLGTLLLLVFCFYYIPYQFIANANYMHFGEWENAAKELTFAGGAFVIAGCFPEKNKNRFTRFLGKLIPLGTILFSLSIVSFGVDHFIYGKDAADYVPSWIPFHVFWIYFAGVALIASGIGIILNFKRGLAATLLGTMIFIWFVSLHLPRVIAAPSADVADEVTSAFFALAYSGIAFVIAGTAKKIV